jgi:hypothetical protein
MNGVSAPSGLRARGSTGPAGLKGRALVFFMAAVRYGELKYQYSGVA